MIGQVVDNEIVSSNVETMTMVEYTPGFYQYLFVLSETERNNVGYYTIVETVPPAVPLDKVLESTFTFDGDSINQVWILRNKNTDEVRADNFKVLSNETTLDNDMVLLKAFLSDPDIQIVLDQPNTTALTTQQLNRALKAIIRQLRRSANFNMRHTRTVYSPYNPALLDNITDTNVT